MKSHWVLLQQVEWEGSGIIASEASKHAIELDVRRLDRGDDIPDADQVDGLVIMGGPFGAYEEEWYPFLGKECALLESVARRGRPLLGVCLGAQLLAKALGGKLFPGHGAEIAFDSVELNAEGRQDRLLASAGHTLPVHWHGDSFSLPDGAVLLASNENYPHQAFRFGSCAYGLQFHLEPDAKHIVCSNREAFLLAWTVCHPSWCVLSISVTPWPSFHLTPSINVLNLPDSQSPTLRLAQTGSDSQPSALIDPESKGHHSLVAFDACDPQNRATAANIDKLSSLLQPLMDPEASLSS